jgi:hypothetical protein
MSSEMIAALIPIVSVLAVFGFPVAIVFVIKYFKLKERELAVEMESRQRSERQQLAIEQRVERLEEVLLSLDHDVRARLGIEQAPSRPELMEAPASADTEQPQSLPGARVKAP